MNKRFSIVVDGYLLSRIKMECRESVKGFPDILVDGGKIIFSDLLLAQRCGKSKTLDTIIEALRHSIRTEALDRE